MSRTLSFSLFRPPFPPNPAVRLVPQHSRTCEADGAGGCAESPVHAGDRVPYEAAQHSVLQTQAATGVIRNHLAQQVPAAGSRKVSAQPRLRGTRYGSRCWAGRGPLPVLKPHHGCLRAPRPTSQTGYVRFCWWPMGNYPPQSCNQSERKQGKKEGLEGWEADPCASLP